MLTVPNRFPTIDSRHRLALIGEAPSYDDLSTGEPFSGAAGRCLASITSSSGLAISCCFKGNICQHFPPAGKLSAFKYPGEEIQAGLEQLKIDLTKFNPNIIVCLGNLPLKIAKDPQSSHPLLPKLFKFKVSKWRGSLFHSQAILLREQKFMSTYPPSYSLRDIKTIPLLKFDLKRAVDESLAPGLQLPQRLILNTPTYAQCLDNLRQLRANPQPIALDIEGGIGSLSCISFATLPNLAFIIPFIRKDGTSVWTAEEETRLWKELALVLEDERLPKILQNSLYDTFVLHYSYHIRVRNVADDTMLLHWSKYCELKKSLALQTSIYTKEPYYKFMRLQNEADDKPEKETDEL